MHNIFLEMLFTPTHTYFSFLSAHSICVSAGSVELIQRSAVLREKAATPRLFKLRPQQVIPPPTATCSDASDPLAAHIKSPIDWPDRLGCRDQMRCKEVLNCCALNGADLRTKRSHLLAL